MQFREKTCVRGHRSYTKSVVKIIAPLGAECGGYKDGS